MGKRYQVVAAVAILTQDSITGPTKQHLYKGAIVGPGMTEKERQHHLDSGYIAEIPDNEPAGLDAAGEPVVGNRRTVGEGEPGEFFDPLNPGQQTATLADREDFTLSEGEKSDTEKAEESAAKADDADAAEAARAAAREKLPTDGSAPDGRAGKQVWVEYAVAKGYDRATVEASDRDEIKALFKQ